MSWHFKRSGSRHFAQTVVRVALFAAGLSLLAYVPYKYLTQLHTLRGLYAVLFPLSTLIGGAGIAIAVDSRSLLKLPRLARAALASVAALWLITGILCLPSLLETAAAWPPKGLFAIFHMAAQHLFVSLAVFGALVAPETAQKWLGDSVTAAPERVDDPQLVRST